MQQNINVLKQQVNLEGSRPWNLAISIHFKSELAIRVENCFAFMFTNLGDTIAFVNGMVVFPSATPLTALGDSRALSGHWLDLYKGNLNISFAVPLGANPKLEMVQLFYSEETIKK